MAASPSRSARRGISRALVLAAALLSGCSSMSSAGNTVSGWFGGSEHKGEFYCTTAGLNVHTEAKVASPVVGHLRLNEKVTRTNLKDGLALVKARDGKLKGWVLNSRLAVKPKSATKSATGAAAQTAAPSETAPEESAAAPTEEEATAAPAQVEPEQTGEAPAATEAPVAAPAEEADATPDAPDAQAPNVGASVFDPY